VTGSGPSGSGAPSYDPAAADPSGHPSVERALSDLDEARALPIEARVSALEAVHRQLAEALDPPPGNDQSRPSAAGV
jgi:hypothetical protein